MQFISTLLVFAVQVKCTIEAVKSKDVSVLSPVTQPSTDIIPADDKPLSIFHSPLADEFQLTPEESRTSNTYVAFGQSSNFVGKHSIRGPPYSVNNIPASSTKRQENQTPKPKARKFQPAPEDDSCSEKSDGYYQKLSSDCTSYYFCAQGYQITYMCSVGQRFDGKRCRSDYQCPKKPGLKNPCTGKRNGYYANLFHPEKYFYCYNRVKVIDLSCSENKIFLHDKCVSRNSMRRKSSVEVEMSRGDHGGDDDEDRKASCEDSPNGFYPLRESSCRKYYYCIGGEKTELTCQQNYVFNGDICLHNSKYTCPYGESGEM